MESQDLQGCHEDWDDFVKSQTKEIHELQSRVKLLESYIQHVEWHCFVYRDALRRVEGGTETFKKALEEGETRTEPFCSSCERDELLSCIAQSKQPAVCISPILGTKSNKRRKCESASDK